MKTLIIISLLLFILIKTSISQCSDAGVCFLGHKSKFETEKSNGNISLSTSFATSDKATDVKYFSIKTGISYNIIDNGFLNASLPVNFASGPLGNKNTFGDIITLYNHKLSINKTAYFVLRAGFKFATGVMSNLPMAYQIGTGTNDILLGVSYRTNKIILSAGF